MKTKNEILNIIEEEDVEFVRLQFTDPLGNLRNVAVTARMIETKCAKEMLDDMHKRKIDMADEILLYRIKHPLGNRICQGDREGCALFGSIEKPPEFSPRG